MRRPPLITLFATLLSLEAFYELVIFPISMQQEAFKPLLEQFPVDISLLVPFGLTKGVYALIGAMGLWFRKDIVRYYLMIVTPLFPVVSLFLTGSLGLAPLGFAFSLMYVIYLRRPEYIDWFNHISEEYQELNTPLSFGDVKTEVKPRTVINTLGLVFGGYFLINCVISFSMFSLPLDTDLLISFIIQLGLFAAFTASALYFGDTSKWIARLGHQLILVAVTVIVYSFLLLSILDTEQSELLNDLFGGALSGKLVLQTSLYGLFLLMIGIPLKRSGSTPQTE
ncbi:hypothetical protein EP331_09885 [bacterium]|nr:MAG: hypothetical protein EP331_09885 [bacterium]